jgi:hypothetical protein
MRERCRCPKTHTHQVVSKMYDYRLQVGAMMNFLPSRRELLILDDCLGRVNFQSDLMVRLATAGRHYDLTIWCAFQLYHKVPTTLRENADYVFLLGSVSDKVAKAVFEEYGSPGFENHNDVRRFATNAVSNYGSLLIDRTDDSNLKVVRAPENPKPFRLR